MAVHWNDLAAESRQSSLQTPEVLPPVRLDDFHDHHGDVGALLDAAMRQSHCQTQYSRFLPVAQQDAQRRQTDYFVPDALERQQVHCREYRAKKA